MSDGFLSHVSCEACGSADARALYEDGHSYCFSHGCPKPFDPAPRGDKQEPQILEAQGARAISSLLTIDASQGVTPRHIWPATTQKYHYGWATMGEDIVQVAEYRDASGQPVAQKVRTRDKDFFWLGEPKKAGLFGDHLCRKGGKRVTITEGELDALAASQAQGNTWPVVSVPNGAAGAVDSITAALEWLEGYDEVILLFDQDEPGRKAAAECALLFSPGKVKIGTLPHKDACEMLAKGMDRELRSAIWEARAYQPDGIATGDEIFEAMMSIGKEPTVPSYHPGLDSLLRGMRRGKIYTVCAGSGIGKSTFTKEEGAHLLTQMDPAEKLGCVMLEENIGESAMHFCTIQANRPLHLDAKDPDEAERRGFWDTYADRIVMHNHFGSLAGKNLLSKIRFMVQALNCKWIILDHISIVVSGMNVSEDERRTIDHLMTGLRSMVEELGFGLILVSHLKRLAGEQKGFEQGTEPQLSHLRGSAAIEQISDVVIGLGRNQQCADNPTVAHVRVLKNRPASITGSAGYLNYSLDTGRLLPCPPPEAAKKHGFKPTQEQEQAAAMFV